MNLSHLLVDGSPWIDRVWYNGSLFTFPAIGEETQGQFALIEAVVRKGNAPPRHVHDREDEAFYVLEGETTVSVVDRSTAATPGTMIFLPRDIAHSFVIESEHLRALILSRPLVWKDGSRNSVCPHP